MTDLPASTAPAAARLPLVRGYCPACRGESLFLGDGGYVTCARLDCPDPCAATDWLEQRDKPAVAGQQPPAEPPRCGEECAEGHVHAGRCTAQAGHDEHERAARCFMENHPWQITHWRRRAETAEERLRAVTAALEINPT